MQCCRAHTMLSIPAFYRDPRKSSQRPRVRAVGKLPNALKIRTPPQTMMLTSSAHNSLVRLRSIPSSTQRTRSSLCRRLVTQVGKAVPLKTLVQNPNPPPVPYRQLRTVEARPMKDEDQIDSGFIPIASAIICDRPSIAVLMTTGSLVYT